MKEAPGSAGAFLFFTVLSVANWGEHFGNFFEIQIGSSLLGIRRFVVVWGLDKKMDGFDRCFAGRAAVDLSV
jgi:hypothetical protein